MLIGLEQIRFYVADCEDGELTLIDGDTESEGRLEVCLDQRWGSIGSKGWTQLNTVVVCNYFGYETSGKVSVKNKKYHGAYQVLLNSEPITIFPTSFFKANVAQQCNLL